MKILIYDKLLDATGVPAAITTPALSDFYDDAVTFTATFAAYEKIDCVGIGYTDATQFTVTNGTDTRTISITKDAPYQNGLYLIDAIYPGGEYNTTMTFSHNGSYVGRVGAGEYRKIGTSPTKEIGFYDTSENRITLSGQVITGAGGFYGRRFEADVRYKLDEDVYEDILAAYQKQIMKGYPYFIYTDDEQHKLPATMLYFYARTDKPISLLQSSTYKFLYSYKFKFYEAF